VNDPVMELVREMDKELDPDPVWVSDGVGVMVMDEVPEKLLETDEVYDLETDDEYEVDTEAE